MHVLVIEDNLEIGGNIVDFLQARSHLVDFATHGKHGLRMLSENDYDVVVLDLMLPDMDGLKLCSSLRRDARLGSIPVLMLTARDTLEDKLSGFTAGADDYLVKPFSLLELEARLQALYQRRSALGQTRMLSCADIEYDIDNARICRGKRELALPGVSRKILEILMRANGRTVSRRELSQIIWGDHPPDADALSVHVHTLRAALHADGEKPVLQTVRGQGYRLAAGS